MVVTAWDVRTPSVASVDDCLRLPSLRGGEVRGGHTGLGAGVRWASLAEQVAGCAPGELRLVRAPLGETEVAAAAECGAAALAATRVSREAAAAATRLAIPVIAVPVTTHLGAVEAEILDFVIASLETTITRLQQVGARLGAAACADLRVQAVAEALACTTGVPVLIEDAQFQMLCATGEGPIDRNRAETIRAGGTPAAFRATAAMRSFYGELAAGVHPTRLNPDPAIGLTLPRLIAPIRAGAELLGFVTLILPERYSAQQLCACALEQSVPLLALALLHERSGVPGERLLHATLVCDLLDRGRDPDLTAARAARLGVDPAADHAPLVIGRDSGEPADRALDRVRATLRARGPVLAEAIGDGIVVLITGGRGEQLERAESLRRAVGAGPAVLGRAVVLAELPVAYSEARRTLDLAARADRPGLLDVDDLGLLGVLIDATAEGTVDRFWRQRLDPLVEYDRREGTDLCGSLAAFLDAGGLRPAARLLGIHPNSLSYRLQRAEAVGAFRLDDAEHRLELSLALRCRRLLAT